MSDNIGDRFKRYERATDIYLSRRTPVIGRIDGRAFHTLTRGCQKPFDHRFIEVMQHTASRLCEEVQGCKLAYVQSDEISLLLIDYDTVVTEAWFDYRLQKMCSVAASIASVAFSDSYRKQVEFDARFNNVPENDVTNYFIWRQQDMERNSLNMLAASHFSPKQLHGKNSSDRHEMLHSVDVNWNNLATHIKRGTCIVRDEETRNWIPDLEIPIFTQDRGYIESRLPK